MIGWMKIVGCLGGAGVEWLRERGLTGPTWDGTKRQMVKAAAALTQAEDAFELRKQAPEMLERRMKIRAVRRRLEDAVDL